MRLNLFRNKSEVDPSKLLASFQNMGHRIVDVRDSDIVIVGTIDIFKDGWNEAKAYHKPFAVYCWDFYEWAYEGKHPYHDWQDYLLCLKEASAVFVPSNAQKKRLSDFGVESVVIHTYCPELRDLDTKDERYVLDPVRYYPEDNQFWAETAGQRTGIPVIHSEHKHTREQFDSLIANCSFLTCAYKEASTGGLSLVEGLWNGKPSLISDSPYMGARDYLGKFGTYFDTTSFDDLCLKMKEMFENPKKIDIEEARDYILTNFTPENMARGIINAMEEVL